MTPKAAHLVAILLAQLLCSALAEEAKPKEYPLGPDSSRHDGVPQGVVTKSTWKSTIYPRTIREY